MFICLYLIKLSTCHVRTRILKNRFNVYNSSHVLSLSADKPLRAEMTIIIPTPEEQTNLVKARGYL